MRYDFTSRNPKNGALEAVGYMELSNAGDVPELRFYGDIVSDSWGRGMDEDKCPQDVADFLNGLDNDAPLDIRINSGGGSVDGGTAIYNRLRRHRGFKTVYIDGIAASIASVIAFSGDKVVMLKGAQLMIHKPWIRSRGNAEDLRRKADTLDVIENAMLEIYMRHVKNGVTEEQIKQMMARETWLTGKQAAQYFNIDIEDRGGIAACASLFFEEYNNLPEGVKAQGADNGEKDNGSGEKNNGSGVKDNGGENNPETDNGEAGTGSTGASVGNYAAFTGGADKKADAEGNGADNSKPDGSGDTRASLNGGLNEGATAEDLRALSILSDLDYI